MTLVVLAFIMIHKIPRFCGKKKKKKEKKGKQEKKSFFDHTSLGEPVYRFTNNNFYLKNEEMMQVT
jgi:hypothetical protein